MIADKEIPVLISTEVPDFAKQDKAIINEPIESTRKIFDLFSHFTDYTICEIKNHKWKHVKRCFQFAEKVYNNGSSMAREAIENMFMYRICNLIDVTENRDHVIDLMPPVFQSIRLKQIFSHGN